jgi:hypothetical protein
MWSDQGCPLLPFLLSSADVAVRGANVHCPQLPWCTDRARHSPGSHRAVATPKSADMSPTTVRPPPHMLQWPWPGAEVKQPELRGGQVIWACPPAFSLHFTVKVSICQGLGGFSHWILSVGFFCFYFFVGG